MQEIKISNHKIMNQNSLINNLNLLNKLKEKEIILILKADALKLLAQNLCKKIMFLKDKLNLFY